MRTSIRDRVRATRSLARGFRVRKDVANVLDVAQHLWSQLNTPVSLGLYLLAKNGQIEDIVRTKFQPERYLDTDLVTARDDYQAIAFLQKCPLEVEGIDREATAFDAFLKAEEQCSLTNARFRNLQLSRVEIRLAEALSRAQRKIAEILGPRVDARSWALRCRFGPGADTLNKGRRASAYHKLSRQSVTAGFYDGAQALVQDHPAWLYSLSGLVGSDPETQGPPRLPTFSVQSGNTVMFVPKNALTYRSIAIEPGMNIYAQLGLGALIRSKLKSSGLDLDTADVNRWLAFEGSRCGTIATIDLSSASDTVSRELVRFLLPDHWYLCLNWCRSLSGQYVRSDGSTVSLTYEKFSSMGNGYTFELESLIFYSLALACTEMLREDTSVVKAFGDDITCPVGVVPLLREVFSFCGFTFNPAKSFSSGVFRESCGMDFWKGVNIRPYFCKQSQLNDATSIYKLANGLRRVAYRRNAYFGCDGKLRRTWVRVVSWLPRALRNLAVPYSPVKWTHKGLARFEEIEDSDSGLILNLDEASRSPWVIPNKDYQRGWLYASLVERGQSTSVDHWPTMLAFGLYSFRDGTSPPEPFEHVSVRGLGGRRLATRQPAVSWGNLGPWI